MTDLRPITAQSRVLLRMAESIIHDLDNSHRALEPAPGVKTAGWLIGHLSVTGDFGRKLCGRTPLCPREWRASFNPQTQPSRESGEYPEMSALREMLGSVYSDFCDAAESVDAALLETVNPYVPSQRDYPTVGHFVPYLLTGHLGYHVGQLRTWRNVLHATQDA